MDKYIDVIRSSMPPLDEFTNEIRELWDTHWLTNMGCKHTALEIELLKYMAVENITLFVNGHFALEAVINCFHLSGEVITTPFTFVSTTHAILRSGLTPVFCDINPDDYTIDVEKIESLINERTTAILPVHVYGNICNTLEIERIAKKHNLKVIYDAAHSFGVTVDGIGVGNFGDASMFSFHATKVFNTIEGGAVTYPDTENNLKTKLNYWKNFGITGPETVEAIGCNAKMNEFQAAMGLCNLRYVEAEIEKRRLVHERYFERLNGISGIKLPSPSSLQKNIKRNFSYFPVLFDGFKLSRDEVFEKFLSNNIRTRKYFYPTINSLDCYRDKFNSHNTPIAKYISERILTLPMYADLALSDVDRICDILL